MNKNTIQKTIWNVAYKSDMGIEFFHLVREPWSETKNCLDNVLVGQFNEHSIFTNIQIKVVKQMEKNSYKYHLLNWHGCHVAITSSIYFYFLIWNRFEYDEFVMNEISHLGFPNKVSLHILVDINYAEFTAFDLFSDKFYATVHKLAKMLKLYTHNFGWTVFRYEIDIVYDQLTKNRE